VPIAVGSRIGPYQITALIGAGGMGEVYRATDTRLGRDVAIKALPAEVAGDPERLARFRREAQVLALLNHPNIAAIHGLEDADGTPLLVLELVEGEDLAARLARGPIPIDEAIAIARHIAEGLEEAHEKGIVHRDLKPANVKVAPDGKVKILDFGLAKAFTSAESSVAPSDLSRSPTLAQTAGLILGTVGYMAPEQARGRPVDRRADIWAFGVVLWEMLAGRLLFQGETASDVMAAVLTRDPDWTALPPGTPPHVVKLVKRCLEREPRSRLQAIGDARIELERGAEPGLPAAAPAGGRRAWLTIAIILASVAAGAAAMNALRPSTRLAPAASRIAFEVNPPDGNHFTTGLDLSRDGQSLVFVAHDASGLASLWLRRLDALEAHRLEGTEGARYPFWSHDGRHIGFFADNTLKVIDLVGGGVRILTATGNTTDTRGGTWGAGDRIVYASTFSGGLSVINAQGGAPEPATELDATRQDGTHRWPWFLPDGRHFLFYACHGGGSEPGDLRLGTLGATTARTLTTAMSRGVFLPPRYAAFVLGKTLMAQEIDVERQVLAGDPIPLDIELEGSLSVSGFRFLSAAGDGSLAYRQVPGTVSRLVWTDRSGQVLSTAVDDGAWHNYPRLSPDGRVISVATYIPGRGSGAIVLHDSERHLDTPLTFDEEDSPAALWMPGGRRLAVWSASATSAVISILDPAHPGQKTEIFKGTRSTNIFDDIFPDGSILMTMAGKSNHFDLYRLSPVAGATPVPLVSSPFSQVNGALTSDGRWLAYAGDTTGRFEVYVRSLASGEEWRVTKNGGNFPLWRKDGRELYYVSPLGMILAVPTVVGATFSMGKEAPLFAGMLEDGGGRQYEATPDGQKFLLNRRIETADRPIVMRLGLTDRLAARKP
jgi:Tol biopolymer transport system component